MTGHRGECYKKDNPIQLEPTNHQTTDRYFHSIPHYATYHTLTSVSISVSTTTYPQLETSSVRHGVTFS